MFRKLLIYLIIATLVLSNGFALPSFAAAPNVTTVKENSIESFYGAYLINESKVMFLQVDHRGLTIIKRTLGSLETNVGTAKLESKSMVLDKGILKFQGGTIRSIAKRSDGSYLIVTEKLGHLSASKKTSLELLLRDPNVSLYVAEETANKPSPQKDQNSNFNIGLIKVTVDGKPVYFKEQTGWPFLDPANRTQVPLRITMESAGCTVTWDDKTKTATVVKAGITVQIPVGQNFITINGVKKAIDTAAQLKGGITYLPIRPVIEAFGDKVKWFDDTNVVAVTTSSAADKNFSKEKLAALIDETAVSEEVADFRLQSNPRRNGMLKVEGKYFDLYYPNTEDGARVAAFLTPYMDLSYIFLSSLFKGFQAKVEVHLIDEYAASGLREGDIRRTESVTFVWMEQNNDDGGNNLSELIHEMFHNFYSQKNNRYSWLDDDWATFVDEALAKLVASLVITNLYDGNVANWKIAKDMPTAVQGIYDSIGMEPMSLEYGTVTYLNGRIYPWAVPRSKEEKAAQALCLAFWMDKYNTDGVEKIQEVLTTIGTGDVKSHLEKVYGKPMDQMSEELNAKIKLMIETSNQIRK